MEVNYNYYLVTYFAIVNCITAQILDPVTQEEIFGSGQSAKDNPVSNRSTALDMNRKESKATKG